MDSAAFPQAGSRSEAAPDTAGGFLVETIVLRSFILALLIPIDAFLLWVLWNMHVDATGKRKRRRSAADHERPLY